MDTAVATSTHILRYVLHFPGQSLQQRIAGEAGAKDGKLLLCFDMRVSIP